MLDDRLPVTVAGAAAVSNRVPLNPFREPRAFSNAKADARCRQFGAAARAICVEYSVFSQDFEMCRRSNGGFTAEASHAVTIRRISKFRQIARENRRGSFDAWECDGLDISIQPDRHLPIETLDRAAEHDYDVSKEHQERACRDPRY
jgi:hypothetical protein